MYAINWQGKVLPGWPVIIEADETLANSPIIADINGDGNPDIVFLGSKKKDKHLELYLWALNQEGKPLDGFPIFIERGSLFNVSPVFTNLEKDNRQKGELIYCGDQKLFVLKLDVPFKKENSPWPMFRANPSRTGELKQ